MVHSKILVRSIIDSSLAAVHIFGRSWSVWTTKTNLHWLWHTVKKGHRIKQKGCLILTVIKASEHSFPPGKKWRKKHIEELNSSTKWIMVIMLNIGMFSMVTSSNTTGVCHEQILPLSYWVIYSWFVCKQQPCLIHNSIVPTTTNVRKGKVKKGIVLITFSRYDPICHINFTSTSCIP